MGHVGVHAKIVPASGEAIPVGEPVRAQQRFERGALHVGEALAAQFGFDAGDGLVQLGLIKLGFTQLLFPKAAGGGDFSIWPAGLSCASCISAGAALSATVWV